MRISFWAAAILITFQVPYSGAQGLHLRKPNRTKHGLRQGLWIGYADSSHTIIDWKGRFKKGNEKGVWKYYYSNGFVRKKEKYYARKIKTYNYYENGRVQSTGYAKIESDEEKLHYFYYGPWYYYSEEGKPTKIAYYEKGDIVKEEIIK